MKGTIKNFFSSKPHAAFIPVLAVFLVFVFYFAANSWGKTNETDKQESASKKQEIQAEKKTKDDTPANVEINMGMTPYYSWPFPDYTDLDPFAEMRLMHERMERLFDSTFSRFRRSPGFILRNNDFSFSPKMDISEDKENYIVRMDVPGVPKSAISIKVRDNNLVITGKRDEKVENIKDDKSVKMISYERSYGQFTRVCPLLGPFDKDKIKAKYENGVLTVTVPKTEKEKTETEIKIE